MTQISLRYVALVSAAFSREDLSGCAHSMTFLNVQKNQAPKIGFYQNGPKFRSAQYLGFPKTTSRVEFVTSSASTLTTMTRRWSRKTGIFLKLCSSKNSSQSRFLGSIVFLYTWQGRSHYLHVVGMGMWEMSWNSFNRKTQGKVLSSLS